MTNHDAKGRSKHGPRYVAVYHYMMKTDAWRSLDCVARCAYVEIARRYGGPGSNNGRIGYSLRQMAENLNVSKTTALRALKRLQERGFIVQMVEGAFSRKVRHASEWRLTEYKCDATGNLASHDYRQWKKQNTGSPEYPNGYRDETERVPRRTSPTAKTPSTVSPEYP